MRRDEMRQVILVVAYIALGWKSARPRLKHIEPIHVSVLTKHCMFYVIVQKMVMTDFNIEKKQAWRRPGSAQSLIWLNWILFQY